MSRFEFSEGQPWPGSCSGMPNYSDACQFLSTVGASSNNSLLDSEMSTGLDTSLSDLMDDDACLEFIDDSLWQEFLPDLLLPITDYEEPGDKLDNHVIRDAHQSTCAAIGNVFNPETNLVPSAVSRSASVRCRWPNFVWLICACNRFSYAAAAAAASLRAKVNSHELNKFEGGLMLFDTFVDDRRLYVVSVCTIWNFDLKSYLEENKLMLGCVPELRSCT